MTFRPLMTAAETSEYLKEQGAGYAVQTLATMRQTGGGIPFRKFGVRVRYHKDDVDAWLKAVPLRSSTSNIPGK